MEENTRLTDLTRMLLSSQAFSSFLSELSGTTLPSSANSLPQSQSQSQPQPTQKDVNPHQIARQLQDQKHQIGMATIPERSVDFPLVDRNISASSWNAGVDLNNFPVYSLTSLPEGPALDIESLSGKSTEDYPFRAPAAVKSDMPVIQYPRSLIEVEGLATTPTTTHDSPDVDIDGTAFSLYAEPVFTPSKSSTHGADTAHRKADSKEAKPLFGLGSHVEIDEAGSAARLELMCSRLDAVSARIAAVTSHLS
jgi:hypothetical protein